VFLLTGIVKTDIAIQVTIRWLSKGPGQEPQQVTGIIVLEVQKNSDKKASQKWLIKTVYSEFNSGTSFVHYCITTLRLT
jgi:hypothetical protein